MDDRNNASDRLRRLASRYEAGVGRGRAEQIAGAAITRAQRSSTLPRRVAVAVSGSAFLVVSLTGVGLAADRAVPGDVLYSIDRALEAVGFRGDLVEERLEEAIALADRGDTTRAASTATEALDEINRRSGAVSPTPVTLPPAESTTTATVQDDDEEDGTTVAIAPVETETSAQVTVAEADDSAAALRLAAEALLESVRQAKADPGAADDVQVAALQLADATALLSGGDTTTTTSSSTTTSTSTTTSSTTTTTVADEQPGNGNGNGNGRGRNGESGDDGTTTTTVPSDADDGSGSEPPGEGEDDSPGPIFLPTP